MKQNVLLFILCAFLACLNLSAQSPSNDEICKTKQDLVDAKDRAGILVWLTALNDLTQQIPDPDLQQINSLVRSKASPWRLSSVWQNKLEAVPTPDTAKGLRVCVLHSDNISLAKENRMVPKIITRSKKGKNNAVGVYTWFLGPRIFLHDTLTQTSLTRGLIFAHEGRHWMQWRKG